MPITLCRYQDGNINTRSVAGMDHGTLAEIAVLPAIEYLPGETAGQRQLMLALTKHRIELVKGFRRKDSATTYDAYLVLTNDFKVRVEVNR